MDVNISKTPGTYENSRALSGRGQHTSGPRRSHGSAGGVTGSGGAAARPLFDAPVPTGGYRWWYIDALSDDGQHGLTLIGFVGSVFSPYYARARKKGQVNPENHCAINIALYGGKRRWAMTERGAQHVMRTEKQFRVGPSSMRWDGQSMVIDINEYCAPLPFPLRGRVLFSPDAFYNSPVDLASNGQHFWQAVAPAGRVTVTFDVPQLSWSGSAYHDMNWGDEPLESGFKNWSWLRAKTSEGVKVLYDVERKNGSCFAFARYFQDGTVTEGNVPEHHLLPRGIWGMKRWVSSETKPLLIGKLEDAPFYTRNHVGLTLDGESCEAFHESLSLDRFVNPFVQMMLPFRMPRRR
jgi:carotenoid 1,2-hydratase